LIKILKEKNATRCNYVMGKKRERGSSMTELSEERGFGLL